MMEFGLKRNFMMPIQDVRGINFMSKLKCRERSTVIERNSIKTITGKDILNKILEFEANNPMADWKDRDKKYIEVDELNLFLESKALPKEILDDLKKELG